MMLPSSEDLLVMMRTSFALNSVAAAANTLTSADSDQNSSTSCFASSSPTSERKISCTVCGRTFTGSKRRYLLNRHYMTHTGERPFHCTYCDYSSSRKYNLKLHILSYHKELLNSINNT